MKRALTVLIGLVLLAALAQPAIAKKKKPKPIAPIPVTLFAHGSGNPGNVEQAPAPAGSGTFLTMDPAEPTESSAKSFFLVGAGAGGTGTPNKNCGGNSTMPVFVGAFQGTVTGPMKFTFFATSAPGAEVEIRVWPDLASQACNDAYIEPARSTVVALPSSGSAEVTLEGADFPATSVLMVQITLTHNVPTLSRILYDSTAEPTKLEFTCRPAAGSTTCV